MSSWLTRSTVVLVVCGLALAAAAMVGPARAQGPEVVIGIGRDVPLNTHISVALAKGFLKAEGLPNVRLKSFAAGAVMVEAIAANEIPVGFSAITAPTILRNNGIPVLLLAQVADNGANNALLVRADANVQKPEDLYRLRLGLLVGSAASNFLTDIARAHGLDPGRLQTVNLAPPDQLAAYRGGQVDGLVVWEPWVSRAEAAKPTAILHTYHESFFPSARRKVDLTQSAIVMIAREEFARTQREALDALLRGLARAQEFIVDRANSEEALTIASRDIKQEPAVNRRAFERVIFKLAVDEGLVRSVRENTRFLNETGKARMSVDPLSWIYTEPLKRARQTWVKIDGQWKP